ncbi:MAG: hypothetical protein ACXACY_26510 [Candidatus Hodarchaeales archaeon]
MDSFKKNKRGVIFVYVVIIVSLISLAFVWFALASVVQRVQEGLNPSLNASAFADTDVYNAFVSASSFITYIWMFFLGLILFGLLYWAYIYSQRKGERY